MSDETLRTEITKRSRSPLGGRDHLRVNIEADKSFEDEFDELREAVNEVLEDE